MARDVHYFRWLPGAEQGTFPGVGTQASPPPLPAPSAM